VRKSHEPLAARRIGQCIELVVREEHLLPRVARGSGTPSAGLRGRCPSQTAGEHEREHAVDLAHGRRREADTTQLSNLSGDLLVGAVRKLDASPAPQNVHPQHAV
jgi:hypothetical protein